MIQKLQCRQMIVLERLNSNPQMKQSYISQLLRQLTNMTLTMTARKRLFTKSAMQVSCTGLQDL